MAGKGAGTVGRTPRVGKTPRNTPATGNTPATESTLASAPDGGRTSGRDRTMRRFLTGQLLVAMPGMADPRFARAVVYICAHSDEGAMGLVINRLLAGVDSADLLEQLGIERTAPTLPLHFGGPVEQGRGFVLHTTDYVREGSLTVDDDVALTATVDVLRAIAERRGPRHHLLALGYAGWGPGQLDHEMQENGWLHAPADLDLLFDDDQDGKWERAIAKLGISLPMLSAEVGHA